MIRFLQRDSRLIKGIFIVIIGLAVITMVITLVPGIFQDSSGAADTYATVHSGGLFGRVFGPSTEITNAQVQQAASRQLQQQRLPDFVLPFMIQRVGQGLIQQAVMLLEADRLGLKVTDEDVRQFLHTGQFGMVLFPNGQYIGDDKYAALIQDNFGISREDFEKQLKKEIQMNRLRAMVTGSATVSDGEVRDAYRQQGTKIKFAYAVLNGDDLRKQINPSDSELQAFFKQNAAKYANAVPEARKLQYVAFGEGQVPGGTPQVSAAEIQQYYNQHKTEFDVPEQVKVRHILIKTPPGADAAANSAALQKAQAILKQIKAGANFADLARKNSDDPGSKEQGGELGFLKRGATVPEFDKVAFSLSAGQTSDVVKTQFGYHILQVEEKQTAHTRTLDEVRPMIEATLTRQKEAQLQQNLASQLATEAQKNGLQKTADAHHLPLVTTDYLEQTAVIPGLADGSKMLTQAFGVKSGAAPQVATTGEGYGIFQVTAVRTAHAPTFDEYKAHILEDYRDQNLPQLLASKTTALAEKAHTENDLEKAAKELGATVKTSDLVGQDAQVPEIGQLASAAPALFKLQPGAISTPINTGRAGIVAKIIDREEPTADEIAKNFPQTRDSLLDQRREEMFAVFVTTLQEKYQKEGRIRLAKKAPNAALPGSPS
ncbi:MAG TPA: peptidyl-prolyl cis-trans isomerase [Acidisarcina sp.]|nr:peptidyl-prolyl cis-trans isomerase [Acidisarcina sp.]